MAFLYIVTLCVCVCRWRVGLWQLFHCGAGSAEGVASDVPCCRQLQCVVWHRQLRPCCWRELSQDGGKWGRVGCVQCCQMEQCYFGEGAVCTVGCTSDGEGDESHHTCTVDNSITFPFCFYRTIGPFCSTLYDSILWRSWKTIQMKLTLVIRSCFALKMVPNCSLPQPCGVKSS